MKRLIIILYLCAITGVVSADNTWHQSSPEWPRNGGDLYLRSGGGFPPEEANIIFRYINNISSNDAVIGFYPDTGLSGNNATQATANLRPAWTPDAGGALDFDGTDDIIQPITTNLADGATQLTISVWYSFDSASAGASIINSQTAGAAPNLEVGISVPGGANKINTFVQTTNGTSILAGFVDPLVFNTTNHVLITWESNGRMTAYTNGVFVGTNTGSVGATGPLSIREAWQIGDNDATGTREIDGILIDMIMWNKVLTAGQALKVYNEGQ